MATDAELNLELLRVIASVATRRVELVDRRGAGATADRRRHRHFHGAGYLDLRVQTREPAWWQAVFLEYMATWSARDGGGEVVTGTIDRSFSAERASDPLVVQPSVTLHPTPWPKLRKLAATIASRCATALPGHDAAFELIRSTAVPG
jgi:hypothetical protein